MLVHSPKDLAIQVISRRKMLKLSQTEVASLVGLKQKTISTFENKPDSTQLDTLFRILSAVGLDITIMGKDKMSATETGWKEEW